MIRKLAYLLILTIIISSCKSNKTGLGGGLDMPVDSKDTEVLTVSEETMESVVENVSSPIEMAALIKALGVPFSKKYLAETSTVDKIVSNSNKAFNLGILVQIWVTLICTTKRQQL
ncbi:MAG: hypothetical protein HC896_05325 [Bacteroidales bacterium]|nr:hypothetical protein [Bacteroidales bacterium]